VSVAVSSEAVSDDDEQPARTSVATAKAVTTFHLYDFCIISLSMIFRSTSSFLPERDEIEIILGELLAEYAKCEAKL